MKNYDIYDLLIHQFIYYFPNPNHKALTLGNTIIFGQENLSE